jgi:transposase-like protein
MNKTTKKTSQQPLSEELATIIDNIDTREGIVSIASHLLNSLMNKEREIFLRNQIEDNKANGFYSRDIACNLGNLNLLVPRDRNSDFRSSVLPNHWQRGDDSYNEFLLNLILQSYSPNKIKALLKSMNLPYSAEEIEEIKEDLFLKAKEFKNKQLTENIFAIFIDAYHTQIKDDENKIKKAVIYSIISIDLKGKKELCGFYTFFGSESKEDWLVIFNNLISRGLKRLALVISDDFSGLKEAISALFPRAKHQLCYIHMQRNIRRNMGKNDAKIFNEELSLIRKDKDKKSALKRFENLCNEYRDKYQFYIEKLLAKKELYFNFIDFPEPIRKHIYTTNIVENFNSRIEVKRINSGGHFQSMKIVDIAIYVIGNNLHQNRWKNPIPAFKECEYEINQLFNLTFAKNAQFLD